MPPHAGFAAALSIGQSTLQDFLRILHNANRIPQNLTATFPIIGSGGQVSINLFVDTPSLTLAAANNPQFVLGLGAWGPLTVQLPGILAVQRSVELTVTVLVTPQLSLQNTGSPPSPSLTVQLQGSTATLQSSNLVLLSGGPFPPAVAAFIASAQFQNLLTQAVRAQISSIPILPVGVGLKILAPLVSAANMAASTRITDGALTIGIDIANASGVTTNGDPSALTDMRQGADLGLWINPAAAPVEFAQIQQKLNDTVQKQGATLEGFFATIEEGHIHLQGSASKTGGSVTFSLNAVPHLVRPGTRQEGDDQYGEHWVIETPPVEELWFEIADLSVDINRDWWVYLLQVVSAFINFGIGTVILESIVDMVRNNILGQAGTASGLLKAPRNSAFTLPNTNNYPTIRLRLERFESHAEGIFSAITIHPQPAPAAIVGPTVISPTKAHGRGTPGPTVQFKPISYSIKLPFDALPNDPQLRVRWTAYRLDTNQIVANTDGPANTNSTLQLPLSAPSLNAAESFSVSCRVYRALGPSITDLFNGTLTLALADSLDRSRPYVKWSHTTFTPIVRVERDGSQSVLGRKPVVRHSEIHRTSVPGRCLMADRYSHWVTRGEAGSGLEYLDELPFPLSELVARRAALCDYCFFGGPTKTVPLIPTS